MKNYAIVDLIGIEVKLTFSNIDEIRNYLGDNEQMQDVVKIINPKLAINGNNIILFNDHYFEWLNLKKKVEKEEISLEVFNAEVSQIMHQVKMDIKFFQDSL